MLLDAHVRHTCKAQLLRQTNGVLTVNVFVQEVSWRQGAKILQVVTAVTVHQAGCHKT